MYVMCVHACVCVHVHECVCVCMHMHACVSVRVFDVADQEDFIPLLEMFYPSSLHNSTASLMCFGSELLKTMHKFMQVHE